MFRAAVDGSKTSKHVTGHSDTKVLTTAPNAVFQLAIMLDIYLKFPGIAKLAGT